MCFRLVRIDWWMHQPSGVWLLHRIFPLGRLLGVQSSDRNTNHSLRNWDMILTCWDSLNSSSESKSIARLASVASGGFVSHNRHPDSLQFSPSSGASMLGKDTHITVGSWTQSTPWKWSSSIHSLEHSVPGFRNTECRRGSLHNNIALKARSLRLSFLLGLSLRLLGVLTKSFLLTCPSLCVYISA